MVLYFQAASSRAQFGLDPLLFSHRLDLEMTVNQVNRIQLSTQARAEAEPNYTGTKVKLDTVNLDYQPQAMTSMDPLDLFRQAITASTPPTLLDAASEPAESLQLASYISFPTEPPTNITKETATRYTSKADTKDEFYNIGQLWLAWTEKDAGVRDYLMKGQAGGVGYVGIADRRGVVEYLQGESDGGARIVSATAVEGQWNWSHKTAFG